MTRVTVLREESNRLYEKAAEHFIAFALLLLIFVGTVFSLVYDNEGGQLIILISVAFAAIVTSIVFFLFFLMTKQNYSKVARELFQEEIVERLNQSVNKK